jgi:signal peptidase II
VQEANSLRDRWLSYGIPFVVALLVLAADQVTKILVRGTLAVGESMPREGVIRITHVTNSGIIFGIDAPKAVSVILPALVIVVALLLYFRYGPFSSWLVNFATALFVGGSLGNLIDRAAFGEVTDFVDIGLWSDYHWPAFNVADASILVGTLLFLIFVFKLRPKKAIKQG